MASGYRTFLARIGRTVFIHLNQLFDKSLKLKTSRIPPLNKNLGGRTVSLKSVLFDVFF